ncbi:MAG: 3-methyl-2-oxobutanoate dehydrogenase subunit VorB [Clostridiales bacterium]|nr:3-methyl-2-oxobutanoate dehydrogenase subunit VorB [Clostridiales bacterium]
MREMVKGNVAIAEAALRAGLQFYAGYPITPQTEVMEYLSGRMPQLDRVFIQSESELAAINMIYGASATGIRSMTSSSGPGMALKQEGISYMCRMQLPCVVLNVTRWGCGLGSLNTAQTDYLRDTRGGGQGGYRTIVLAPNSVQESVDIMQYAFKLAEKYRNPLVIMSEANLGQMREPCEMPEFGPLPSPYVWSLDGTGKNGNNGSWNMAEDVEEDLTGKWLLMKENEQRWVNYRTDDAEFIFVAFGLPSRAVMDAIDVLRGKGEKVGLIRPVSLWPFPEKAFQKFSTEVKAFISVEGTDLGQMIEDVALASKKYINRPVYLLSSGQVLPTVRKICEVYKEIKENHRKAVF